jgi:hypothetical protein
MLSKPSAALVFIGVSVYLRDLAQPRFRSIKRKGAEPRVQLLLIVRRFQE